ncbi:hypothetical protein Tco_0406719 [Tanacetum coccineum]
MDFPVGSTVRALETHIDVAMAHSSWAWLSSSNTNLSSSNSKIIKKYFNPNKDCQGILLERFQDDIKYEHVGPKTQDRQKAKYYKDDQVMMKDRKG